MKTYEIRVNHNGVWKLIADTDSYDWANDICESLSITDGREYGMFYFISGELVKKFSGE